MAKNDHSSVFVPLEAWSYSSPRINYDGGKIDVGLFAESLIYYDKVVLQPTNEPQFAEWVKWFFGQGRFKELLGLLNEGVVIPYCYAFSIAPVLVQETGNYVLLNIQDEESARSSIFESRYLSTKFLQDVLPHARQREQLLRALRGKVIEVKAETFGNAVKNAALDCYDAERVAQIVQFLIDDLRGWHSVDAPTIVIAKVEPIAEESKRITWNVDFKKLNQSLQGRLSIHESTPLAAAAQCNRSILSASEVGADLFLGAPMSLLVRDKLKESCDQTKGQAILEELKTEVEFPNIRDLVNSGQMGLDDVLKIRKHAKRFRKWLQDENDRDHNAILAYHNEVARESGLARVSRRTLQIFGVLGGAGAGAALGGTLGGVPGAVGGAIVGEGLKYVLEVASKINEGWRPSVFGDWLKKQIPAGK